MTFSYDISSNDEAIKKLSQVRFHIGDITEDRDANKGKGVLPNGANVQDEEISPLIESYGTINLAAAALCDLLAVHWGNSPDQVTTVTGETIVSSARSQRFSQLAKDLRHYTPAGATVGTVRTDAYS